METKNFMEPKWLAIGLTALVLLGGAWKIIASMSATENPGALQKTTRAVPQPETGTYAIYETSWEPSSSEANSSSPENLEVDPKDPNHMPYVLNEEERAFALKAAKTWRGLPIAIEGRE